jgi:hypothetical protein
LWFKCQSACLAQGPEFKPQYHKIKKEKKKERRKEGRKEERERKKEAEDGRKYLIPSTTKKCISK